MSDELAREIRELKATQERVTSSLLLVANHSGSFVEKLENSVTTARAALEASEASLSAAKEMSRGLSELTGAFDESKAKVEFLIDSLAQMAENNAKAEIWRRATDQRLDAIEKHLQDEAS